MVIRRRLLLSKKYVAKWEKKLAECNDWKKVFHTGELLQANLYQIQKGAHEISVSDWEDNGNLCTLSLHPPLHPSEEVKNYFKKAKKLKKGIEFAEKEVEKGQLEIEKWTALLAKLEEDPTFIVEQGILPPKQKKFREEKLPPKPYHEFISPANIPIWVGKNAAMNDILTFQHAHGNDLWLHVADYPGSHVIIHPQKNQTIDDETLNLALQLALYYSKARQRKEGDIVMTQVKHVFRKGKERGKVLIHHEKRVFCRLLHKFA